MKFPEDEFVEKIWVDNIWFKKRRNFCYLANLCLKGYGIKEKKRKGNVICELNNKKIVSGKGGIEGNIFEKRGEKIEVIPDENPRIIVDLRYKNLLTNIERKSLYKQLMFGINFVRSLYWETSLRFLGEGFLGIKTLNDIPNNSVLLDPYGEKELKEFDWKKRYVILGIIDKGNRLKGISSQIAEEYGLKTYRIRLRNLLLGVPYTIDRIILILLLLMRGINVEDAVLLSAPKRWLKKRIESEMRKKEKDEKFINKMKKVLKIDIYDFILKLNFRNFKSLDFWN